MTPKEFQVLEFIRSFVSKHHYSPTVSEIALAIGMSSRGTVYRYLQQLAEGGHILMKQGKQRNIQLTQQGWCNHGQGLNLPLLGRIAAGKPIEAILNQEHVDLGMFVGDDRYVLKVYGDSMIDEGIYDGDLVVCQHAQRANNGDIVVALIDKAFATLKKFFRNESGQIVLKPANTELTPVTYAANRIEVQGIFLGLLRLKH